MIVSPSRTSMDVQCGEANLCQTPSPSPSITASVTAMIGRSMSEARQ